MRKVIGGKVYDTEKATEVGRSAHGSTSDFGYYEETLFRKRTGEYFLYGYGHGASKYAEYHGGAWGEGGRFMPLALDDARGWAERELDADAYKEEFGVVEEVADSETVAVTFRIPATAKAALDRECSRTGESRTAIVTRLLEALR